jgi:hypothetical protein
MRCASTWALGKCSNRHVCMHVASVLRASHRGALCSGPGAGSEADSSIHAVLQSAGAPLQEAAMHDTMYTCMRCMRHARGHARRCSGGACMPLTLLCAPAAPCEQHGSAARLRLYIRCHRCNGRSFNGRSFCFMAAAAPLLLPAQWQLALLRMARVQCHQAECL